MKCGLMTKNVQQLFWTLGPTCWGVWSTGEFSWNSSPILKMILFVFKDTCLREFNFVQVNSKQKAYNISCYWKAVNLECHVPLISLSDYLNGGTCVRQHFPIFSIFVKIFPDFLPDLSIQGTPMVVRYSSNPSLFSCTKVPTALSIALKCSLRRPGMGPHRTLQIGWNFYNAEIWR